MDNEVVRNLQAEKVGHREKRVALPKSGASSAKVSALEREKPMGEIIDKLRGRIKQAAGALASDKRLKNEGRADETKGEMKGAVEDLKHAVKDNK